MKLLRFLIIIIFSLSSIFYTLFSTPFAHAQTYQTQVNPYAMPQTNPDVPANLHTFTQSLTIDALSAIYCGIAGYDPVTQDHRCLSYDSQTHRIGYAQSSEGLLGIMTNAIAVLYISPIHTRDYISYIGGNFGITHAYAQGIGEQGLNPLLKLWVGARNFSYLFMTIIFILVGLFIMLRVKIDPRTVMSLQNQLPKIIVGLVLMTFSFALVAILIDGMYVITYLGLNLIYSATGDHSVLTTPVQGTPIDVVGWDIFGTLSGGVGGAAGQAANAAIKNIPVIGGLNDLLGWVSGCTVFTAVPGLGSFAPSYCGTQAVGANSTGVIGSITTLVIGIIVFLAVFIALVKIWFALLKAYVAILYNTVLGPIMIMFGMLPGLPGGFGGWFKGIVANLTIFPAVLLFLVLGKEFAQAFNNQATAFLPPLTGLIGGVNNLGNVMYFITIMMAPKLPDEIIKMFKAQNELANSIGGSFAAGAGVITGGAGAFMRRSFRPEDQYHGLNQGWLRNILVGQAHADPLSLNPIQRFIRQRVVGQSFGEKAQVKNPVGGKPAEDMMGNLQPNR